MAAKTYRPSSNKCRRAAATSLDQCAGAEAHRTQTNRQNIAGDLRDIAVALWHVQRLDVSLYAAAPGRETDHVADAVAAAYFVWGLCSPHYPACRIAVTVPAA